jgi:hypothetical protein
MRTAALLLAPLRIFAAEDPDFPYRHGGIAVPKASASEPQREQPSAEAALHYLEQDALAWADGRRIRCLLSPSAASSLPPHTDAGQSTPPTWPRPQPAYFGSNLCSIRIRSEPASMTW